MFEEQQRREAANVLCHALSSHVSCQPGQRAPLRREGPRQLVVVEVPGTTGSKERGERWSAVQALHTSHPSIIELPPLAAVNTAVHA